MTDGGKSKIDGDFFSLLVSLDSAEQVTTVFNNLSDGGKVVSPLATQFWATLCGDVEDRFGINWHVCTQD